MRHSWMIGGAALFALAGVAQADTINFGQFGAEGAGVANGASGVTTGGVSFTISTTQLLAPGSMLRVNEGSGWTGEFQHGTPLVFDEDDGDAIDLVFATPITSLSHISAQAEIGGVYTATAQFFDGLTLIGTETYVGDNTGLGPEGTIPQFNFTAGSGFDITSVVLTTTLNDDGFAVGGVGGAPEPATWALMLTGIAGLGAALRSRRKLATA